MNSPISTYRSPLLGWLTIKPSSRRIGAAMANSSAEAEREMVLQFVWRVIEVECGDVLALKFARPRANIPEGPR